MTPKHRVSNFIVTQVCQLALMLVISSPFIIAIAAIMLEHQPADADVGTMPPESLEISTRAVVVNPETLAIELKPLEGTSRRPQ